MPVSPPPELAGRPIVALAALCETLPDHADWMEWYAVITRHSQYLRTLARFTAPYHLLPASIYGLDESTDPRFLEQVRSGVRLDDKHYLRVFPVWFNLRGNSGTVLSQTKALSVAARLRHDPALDDLVQQQLQWHVGRNPFAQSLMFGEGHDYAPQYTAMSGDLGLAAGGCPDAQALRPPVLARGELLQLQGESSPCL